MFALIQEYFYIRHNLPLEWMYAIGQLKRQGMPNAVLPAIKLPLYEEESITKGPEENISVLFPFR